MNKTETVIATNKSMGAYCSEATDGKIATRSVTIVRTPRRYCDIYDLLDRIIPAHQAVTIKQDLLDTLFCVPHVHMIHIIFVCFLLGDEEVIRKIIHSRARQSKRSITVKQTLSDQNDCTITATIIMHPDQYWKIEQRFFPDL